MPWKEFTVDNSNPTGIEGRRKDKACIIIFETSHVKFRITARYHDGHFKYYLDCEEADYYESWIALPTMESRYSIKRVAINLLKTRFSSNIKAIIDLNTAEKEIEFNR